jgi:ankyrin repeat protein
LTCEIEADRASSKTRLTTVGIERQRSSSDWIVGNPDTKRDSFLIARDTRSTGVDKKLLRAGAEVNTRDADGTTALMHSVIESDVTMMKLLLDSGAEVNAKNTQDSTALMYAAVSLEKTQLLVGRGADVDVKGKGGATPMSVAVATFGSTPVLKLLLAMGAKPENRLMLGVAQKGDLEAIRYLLSIGMSPAKRTAPQYSLRSRRDVTNARACWSTRALQ